MFNTVDDLYESLMNQLKDRIAKTKTITTLFICGVLLVGFGTVSLSFSQSAMAQQGPPEDGRGPCPEGQRFDRGECVEIVLVCEDPFELNEETGMCEQLLEEEADCPDGFELNEETDLCERTITEQPTCSSGHTFAIRADGTGGCANPAGNFPPGQQPPRCGTGFTLSDDRTQCVKTETDQPECSGDLIYNPETNQCELLVEEEPEEEEVRTRPGRGPTRTV